MWRIDASPNLIELQAKIDVDKIILPSDQLVISKVNIQSPGFWEFFGSLNPLQQIREYLKDRHERQKDREYRKGQDRRKGELDILAKENDIIKQRIEILKSAGYSDFEIRPVLAKLITEPLQKLANHQDRGLVDYPDSNG